MRPLALRLAAAAALALAACSAIPPGVRGEGLDATSLPPEIRDDYGVFALRCSKCHSLARSLNSGIDDDEFWARYVARMRRQPASGITRGDEIVILRFLHYYSADVRRRKAAQQGGPPLPQDGGAPAPGL